MKSGEDKGMREMIMMMGMKENSSLMNEKIWNDGQSS